MKGSLLSKIEEPLEDQVQRAETGENRFWEEDFFNEEWGKNSINNLVSLKYCEKQGSELPNNKAIINH